MYYVSSHLERKQCEGKDPICPVCQSIPNAHNTAWPGLAQAVFFEWLNECDHSKGEGGWKSYVGDILVKISTAVKVHVFRGNNLRKWL